FMSAVSDNTPGQEDLRPDYEDEDDVEDDFDLCCAKHLRTARAPDCAGEILLGIRPLWMYSNFKSSHPAKSCRTTVEMTCRQMNLPGMPLLLRLTGPLFFTPRALPHPPAIPSINSAAVIGPRSTLSFAANGPSIRLKKPRI